jgi:acid phosphatase type 7
LCVWGHYHSYERTCPVYHGKCNDQGTTHIVVGTAGIGLDDPNTKVNVEWSVAYILNYGYLDVFVNEEEMTLKFIINSTGAVADSVTLSSKN